MAIEQLSPLNHDEWFALFVKTGSEKAIQHKLRCLNFGSLDFHVPCREIRIRKSGKWVLELQPMFPGYILANGRITERNYSKVVRIADVYCWICDASGPLRIHPDEIAMIRRLTNGCDVIRASKVVYGEQKITVVDGPLEGLEAIIKKVDRRKGRAKIAISVFGNEKLVDIPVEDIGERINQGMRERIAWLGA